jgi:TrmH family RNA methyltransferase
MRIESTTNERVKAVKRLHRSRERRQTGRTLVEGAKLVEAALEAGLVPVEVYLLERWSLADRCESMGSQVFEVNRSVIEALSTTVEPQDVVAIVEMPEPTPLERRRTIVAVGISDPGNTGTLIRTAAALGWQSALLDGADAWSPKALRASAGAQLSHPAIRLHSIEDLTAGGLAPAAMVVSGGLAPSEVHLQQPVALLVGNEARGLSDEMVSRCDVAVTIPMSGGAESLNAAVAGAIAMYALSGPQGDSEILS